MKLSERHTHRLFGRFRVWTVEIESEPHEFAPLSLGHDGIAPTPEELALREREVSALEAGIVAHGGKIERKVAVPTEDEAAGLGALFG